MIFKPFPDNDISQDERLYIMEIQELLRTMQIWRNGNSDVPVDGIFGPMTMEAVQNFQQEHALPVTGVMDRVTYEALIESYNILADKQLRTVTIDPFSPRPGYILRREDRSDATHFLNIMLASISKSFGNIPMPDEEALYTPATEASVRAMQRVLGYAATGVTNRQTWNGITATYNDLLQRFYAKENTPEGNAE